MSHKRDPNFKGYQQECVYVGSKDTYDSVTEEMAKARSKFNKDQKVYVVIEQDSRDGTVAIFLTTRPN